MQCYPHHTLGNGVEFIRVMFGNGPRLQCKYEDLHILLFALECYQNIPRNWI